MMEQMRLPPSVLTDLQGRGWTLSPWGDYHGTPRVQLASEAADGTMSAVSDSRPDPGSLAVRRIRRHR
jgi:hypothetical protein